MNVVLGVNGRSAAYFRGFNVAAMPFTSVDASYVTVLVELKKHKVRLRENGFGVKPLGHSASYVGRLLMFYLLIIKIGVIVL